MFKLMFFIIYCILTWLTGESIRDIETESIHTTLSLLYFMIVTGVSFTIFKD
jgi:hypothetical protein